MKVGEGNARFLSDLAENVPDATMRQRYRDGYYGDTRPDYLKAWRTLSGRT